MPTAARSLLLVEDDALNRDLLTRRLQRHGFRVTSVNDGIAALQLLVQQSYDLVLLDVMLPELSGLEILRIVRQTQSRTQLPIILITALDSTQDIVDGLEFGANDYVTKPFDFTEVLGRIEAHLDIKQLAHPAESTDA
jgi:DNA-binding response OmpR family regulator